MKWLADMGISQRTVTWLRARGEDTIHLREIGQQRAQDPEILHLAVSEARILLTMAPDFGSLLAASGVALPSVVIFRLADERPDSVNARLAEVIDRCTEDLAAGAIVSVCEASIRVRSLPVRPPEAGA